MGGDEDDFVIAPDKTGGRRWWIAVAIVLAALVIGAGAWALLHRPEVALRVRSKPPTIEPAQQTTASPTSEPTSTASATGTPSGDASATPGSQTPTPSVGVRPRRPAYVAFRLDGIVYLSRENGTKAVPVVKTDGVFALSPDARSLAYVDPTRRQLRIVDLSTQTTRTVGVARQMQPRWAPDSSAMLFVRDVPSGHATELLQVKRSNGATSSLGTAIAGAYSPDGSLVAIAPPELHPSGVGALVLFRGGKPLRTLKTPGFVLDVVLAQNGAYVATTRGAQGSQAGGVWFVPFDGSARVLSTADNSREAGDFGSLVLSDDGRHLAFARVGDDGRSQAYIVPTTSGLPVPIGRRDVYPLSWAAGSSALFAIEGNSFQGEQTALVRVTADGRSKAVFVQGADR